MNVHVGKRDLIESGLTNFVGATGNGHRFKLVKLSSILPASNGWVWAVLSLMGYANYIG